MVFIENRPCHGGHQILRRLIDLLHERPVLLHFFRENFGSNVQLIREFRTNVLDDLTINTAVKMLGDQLQIGRNNNH